MGFEGGELVRPQTLGICQPGFQVIHGTMPQRINPHTGIIIRVGLLNEASFLQGPQMPRHGRRRKIERLRQFPCPPRPLAEQFHGPAPRGVGEGCQGPIDGRSQSRRFFVIMPPALSQASGSIFVIVTPKVQIWPSGSRAR